MWWQTAKSRVTLDKIKPLRQTRRPTRLDRRSRAERRLRNLCATCRDTEGGGRGMKFHRYGTIHAYAQCDECGWTDSINISERNRMQALRNRISSHINKTGHSVTLETGNATKYSKQ